MARRCSRWCGTTEPGHCRRRATLAVQDLGGDRTLATYTVRHWSAEDKIMHEQMGFETGWGQCADQLSDLVKTL